MPETSIPLPEAAAWLHERNAWQYAISDALDLTYEDHGRQHADLRRCVEEIASLRRQRQEGWRAAYERGRHDGLLGKPWPPDMALASDEAEARDE